MKKLWVSTGVFGSLTKTAQFISLGDEYILEQVVDFSQDSFWHKVVFLFRTLFRRKQMLLASIELSYDDLQSLNEALKKELQ